MLKLSLMILLFYSRYPYNNALHHHVESIIYSCLETKSSAIVDHLFIDCDLIGKILQAEKNPALYGELNLVNVFLNFLLVVYSGTTIVACSCVSTSMEER